MNALRINLTLLSYVIICLNGTLAQSGGIIVPYCEDDKWGFMNADKEVIVAPIYDLAYPPHYGVARVKLGNKYGYVNMTGELIGSVKYTSATDFRFGSAQVEHRRKNYCISTDGKKNKSYGSTCGHHDTCSHPSINKSLEIISKDNKLGFVFEKAYRNQSGRLQYETDTIAPQFDSIGAISHQVMYLIRGDSISFAHQGSFLAGAEYILDNLDFRYEAIKTFKCTRCSNINEFVGFKENGLWGFKHIDITPKDHISAKYLSIASLADGFSLVEFEEGSFGYIDAKGREYFIRK